MFRRCCFNKCLRNREYRNREKQEYDISMEELKFMQLDGAIIIDVRSPQEYKEGYIKGAINIPEYEIYRTVEKIVPNKDTKLIVYCDTGMRSLNALKRLQKIGYTNVYNLFQGY